MWRGIVAVAAVLTLTVGVAKADVYETYDLSGSFTSFTAYDPSTGLSEGVTAYSGQVTYDLTTQTFSEFSFGDITVVSAGPDYAAEKPDGIYSQYFQYPPGSTLSGLESGGAFCGANESNCVGVILGEDIAQTEVTPLPVALPLFATGLCALGLFGWRKKWDGRPRSSKTREA